MWKTLSLTHPELWLWFWRACKTFKNIHHLLLHWYITFQLNVRNMAHKGKTPNLIWNSLWRVTWYLMPKSQQLDSGIPAWLHFLLQMGILSFWISQLGFCHYGFSHSRFCHLGFGQLEFSVTKDLVIRDSVTKNLVTRDTVNMDSVTKVGH